MLLHYHSRIYPSGFDVDLAVCEFYDQSRPWFADQCYHVRFACGDNICEGHVRRSLVETILLEPLMRLRWERAVDAYFRENVVSLVDGEFWNVSFDYGGISWTLDGHCCYPDKYHEVTSGMIRVATGLLCAQALGEYEMFSERWYGAWCRACRRARPRRWTGPYDPGLYVRFMDGFDDFLDWAGDTFERVEDAIKRRFSDASEKTMEFPGNFEE